MKLYQRFLGGSWLIDPFSESIETLSDGNIEANSYFEEHFVLNMVIEHFAPEVKSINCIRENLDWYRTIATCYQEIHQLSNVLAFNLSIESGITDMLIPAIKYVEACELTRDLPMRLPTELKVAKSLGRAKKIRSGPVTLPHLPAQIALTDLVRFHFSEGKAMREVWMPYQFAHNLAISGYLAECKFDCYVSVSDCLTVSFSHELQYYWASSGNEVRRAIFCLFLRMLPEDLMQYLKLSIADSNSNAVNRIYNRRIC